MTKFAFIVTLLFALTLIASELLGGHGKRKR
jgi:hypothetical protein